jgi:uncharacterized protein (UPF0332 family)
VTEQPALLKKAKRYLESARLLLGAGDYDSAVSRIYYAAFYSAEVLLDACGQSYSSHRGVISAYGQEFARSGILDPRFHRLLIKAFEKRQQADYLAETGLGHDEVAELLSETAMFIKAADSWLEQQPSTKQPEDP